VVPVLHGAAHQRWLLQPQELSKALPQVLKPERYPLTMTRRLSGLQLRHRNE